MSVKRSAAAALVLCLHVLLGSCSPFAGFVSDHWPHWAGGMPNGVPPRPGAPGYAEFIAHGQPSADAEKKPNIAGQTPAAGDEKSAGPTQGPGAAGDQPVAVDESRGAPAAPAADDRQRSDSNVGQGGLY